MAAALILIHWHLIKVVLPKMLDEFKGERIEALATFTKQLEAQRIERAQHLEFVAARQARIETVLDSVREFTQHCCVQDLVTNFLRMEAKLDSIMTEMSLHSRQLELLAPEVRPARDKEK